VVFFAVLMLIPFFTTADTIGTHIQAPSATTHSAAPANEHEGH
jgi:hypothetical protein